MAEKWWRVTVEQTVQSYTDVFAESAEAAQRAFEADPYTGDYYGEERLSEPDVVKVEEVEA